MSLTAKSVSWVINKQQGSLSVDKYSILLEEEGAQEVINVTRSGDGILNVQTSDSSIATAELNSETGEITVTAVDDGEATITVSCSEGTNYFAPANVQINVACEIVPLTMEEMSWEKIVQVIKAGKASKYLHVGDTKTITFPSKITMDEGSIAAGSKWKVVVLGIDHNAAIEGTNRVHFCIGQNEDGKDICFVGHRMNSTNTNIGGWNSSAMKSWINGTFYNALPTDLKSVITECVKYTDNTGNSSRVSDNVTATSQKLWILSEFEVFGSNSHANSYERNSQAQYDYYKKNWKDDSRIRYKHTSQNYVAASMYDWWLRSPYNNSNMNFCYGNTVGRSDITNGAIYARGVVPCFTIS